MQHKSKFRQWLFRPLLREIEDSIHVSYHIIIERMKTIMATLDDIKALADQNATLTATLIAAVNSEAASIAALQEQLAALPPVDPATQGKIDAIAAELSNTVDSLTSATSAAAPASVPTA